MQVLFGVAPNPKQLATRKATTASMGLKLSQMARYAPYGYDYDKTRKEATRFVGVIKAVSLLQRFLKNYRSQLAEKRAIDTKTKTPPFAHYLTPGEGWKVRLQEISEDAAIKLEKGDVIRKPEKWDTEGNEGKGKMLQVPYQIVKGKNGKPVVDSNLIATPVQEAYTPGSKGFLVNFTPQQLSSMSLINLRRNFAQDPNALRHLRTELKSAKEPIRLDHYHTPTHTFGTPEPYLPVADIATTRRNEFLQKRKAKLNAHNMKAGKIPLTERAAVAINAEKIHSDDSSDERKALRTSASFLKEDLKLHQDGKMSAKELRESLDRHHEIDYEMAKHELNA